MVELEQWAYIAMAIVGLGLLLLSVFGGDAGLDADADVSFDHDVSGVSPLSIPLIATFLSTTGAIGSMLSFANFDSGMVGGTSFVAIYVFMAKLLIPAQGSSSVHEKEFEGKTGVVTETISAEGIGAVAVTVRGIRSVISARSGGERIPIGTEVMVKRVGDAIAIVEEVRRA
jgi:membrane protein implicated in regulation of membrane protease activity